MLFSQSDPGVTAPGMLDAKTSTPFAKTRSTSFLMIVATGSSVTAWLMKSFGLSIFPLERP
jgi:hypothetical protein